VGAPATVPGATGDGQAQPVTVPVQSGVGAPVHRPVPVPVATARAEKSGSMTLLYVWIMLFGFVGTQLAWTLRPFFGAPSEGFALFRNIEGNFYTSILRDLANLF
jgi:hypothetical protein